MRNKIDLEIQREEDRFDSFCKTIIRNEARDAFREQARRSARTVSYDSLSQLIAYSSVQEDSYNTYESIYYVGNLKVPVHDENIGDVLKFIVPSIRNVILLGFFLGYSDSEVSSCMKISNATVANRRRVGLRKIRELLEAKKNG